MDLDPGTKLHEHNWVQMGVQIFPGPTAVRPILGALVSWRCTRRGCTGLRETKYDFRRPRKNQAANAFSRPMPEVESGSGLALAMASSLETNNAPIFGED